MSQATLQRAISRIGPLQIAIILLAVVTGLIHLDRGITTSALMGHMPAIMHRPAGFRGSGGSRGFSPMGFLPLPLSTLFYLNFLGYIALVVALYLPLLRTYQRPIRWTLIGYTIITILAWFLITDARPNLYGYIDKPIEVALIVLLVIEDRRVRHGQLGRGVANAV